MKKIILILVAFSLAITSCKKDNDQVAEQSRTNLLTKRTDSDGLIFSYNYDASNKMTSYSRTGNSSNPAQNFSFTYNGNGSLNEAVNTLNNNKTKYTYSTDGRLVQKREFSVSGGIETLRDTYNYTYNGSVVTENYTPASGGNGFIQKYTYNAVGNNTIIDIFNKANPNDQVGTASGAIVYNNYDNKKNTGSSFPVAFTFPSTGNNNYGSIVYPFGTVSFTYEYNSDGYVTKSTDNGGNFSVYTYTRL